LNGGGTTSTVNVNFFTKTYSAPSTTTRDSVTEYYFKDSYTSSISGISSSSGSINDYCPGRYPITRTQRYWSTCSSSDISQCSNQYQIWSGCPLRDNFQYSAIPGSYFTALSTSVDDATDFSDFSSSTSATAACMSF
jgi:hypothetical protein